MLAKVYILKKPRQRDFGRCHVMLNLKNGHFITRGLSAPQQSLPLVVSLQAGSPLSPSWSNSQSPGRANCFQIMNNID